MVAEQESRGVERGEGAGAGQPPPGPLRLGLQDRRRLSLRLRAPESDAGDLLHHLAEVGRVGRDERRVVPLRGPRLALGDLPSRRRYRASLAPRRRRLGLGSSAAGGESRNRGRGGRRGVGLDEIEKGGDDLGIGAGEGSVERRGESVGVSGEGIGNPGVLEGGAEGPGIDDAGQIVGGGH